MGVIQFDVTATDDTSIFTASQQLTRGTLTSAQIVKTVNGPTTPKFSWGVMSLHYGDITNENRIALLASGNILKLHSISWDGMLPIDENMLIVIRVVGYTDDVFRLSATLVDPETGKTGFPRDP